MISAPKTQVDKLARFTQQNISSSDLHMTLAQKIKIWNQNTIKVKTKDA